MRPCPISGKQSYPTPGAAWRVIRPRTGTRSLIGHERPGKPGGHAYRCPHGRQWRITGQKNRSPARIQKRRAVEVRP